MVNKSSIKENDWARKSIQSEERLSSNIINWFLFYDMVGNKIIYFSISKTVDWIIFFWKQLIN